MLILAVVPPRIFVPESSDLVSIDDAPIQLQFLAFWQKRRVPGAASSYPQRTYTTMNSDPLPEAELLTASQVADLLQCSVSTVERRTKDGTIPSLKLGRLRRYTRVSILAMAGLPPEQLTLSQRKEYP
ncbi:MAG TPA: hypothetical protein DDW52_30295 [Planctomycetaceae bacterium]|nr:hypothetical protein [Planctomycetaceae bacterium]